MQLKKKKDWEKMEEKMEVRSNGPKELLEATEVAE